MSELRIDGRAADQLRPVQLTPDFVQSASASFLIEVGRTRVLCNATIEKDVPKWMDREQPPRGWITAEYSLLPQSTNTRVKRERGSVSGRTQEIQRLIGRSLRSVANLHAMPGCSVIVDCDVIEADGGTRTASIVGAFLALGCALRKWKEQNGRTEQILKDYVTAVSVGVLKGQPILDLNYPEDSAAEVDMNLVFASGEKLVEVQGTGEESTFTRAELNALLDLGEKGCQELLALQKQYLPELP
jgi:ribonuclease PH